jgi:hypothetical protein
MHEQLRWIRDAHDVVSRAASIQEVRQAISVALGRFRGAGLKMPVGLLTELNDKASRAGAWSDAPNGRA